MKFIKLIPVLFVVFAVSCQSDQQLQEEIERLKNQEIEELLSEMKVEEDGEFSSSDNHHQPASFTTVFDKPKDMPNACIPIVSDLWESTNRSLYDYLVSHLDTLNPEKKQYDSEGHQCGFSRDFNNGIFYRESYCGEGGWDMSLKTKCPDKDVLYYLLNGLYNGGDYVWNADSTNYGTFDGGAGCYYDILNKDGYFTISAYCGC